MPKDNVTSDNPVPNAGAKLQGWFAGRLPDGWFTGPPSVDHDRDEIVVIGTLPDPDTGDADAETRDAARRARIQGFREDTRALRMRIADEAEARFARKVGDHEGEWIDQLRDALVHVEKVRSEGPGNRTS